MTRIGINIVAGALVLAGLAASIGFFSGSSQNTRLADVPVATAAHVIGGGTYLLVAPFQFLARPRRRAPAVHRWVGRFAASVAIVSGATALVVGVVAPYAGAPESLIVGVFGSYFVVSLVLGVRAARAKRFGEHRAWMIRAFSIGLAIATIRLMYIPLVIVFELGEGAPREWAFAGTFLASFTLHALAAELVIRRGRQSPGRSAAAGEAAKRDESGSAALRATRDG